jgi:hypothetical protein
MMRTTLVALATSAALLVPAGGADAVPAGTAEKGSSIGGTWKGGVFGDHGASAGYQARVTIRRNDRGRWTGRVSYADMCSGRWAFKGRSGGWYRFRERITRDPAGGERCVSPVAVRVRRDGAKLRIRLREPRSGDTATVLARRV